MAGLMADLLAALKACVMVEMTVAMMVVSTAEKTVVFSAAVMVETRVHGSVAMKAFGQVVAMAETNSAMTVEMSVDRGVAQWVA